MISGHIWTINPFLHPLRALGLAIRRRTLRVEASQALPDGDFHDENAIPAALQRFERGELLPWKGLTFRVGKVVGGDFPCIILVPVGLTRGSKLQNMRRFRRIAAELREQKKDTDARLAAETR